MNSSLPYRLSRVVPEHQVELEFGWLVRDYSTFCEGWKSARIKGEPSDACSWCGRKFIFGDEIALAGGIPYEVNKILCQTCAKEAPRG